MLDFIVIMRNLSDYLFFPALELITSALCEGVEGQRIQLGLEV